MRSLLFTPRGRRLGCYRRVAHGERSPDRLKIHPALPARRCNIRHACPRRVRHPLCRGGGVHQLRRVFGGAEVADPLPVQLCRRHPDRPCSLARCCLGHRRSAPQLRTRGGNGAGGRSGHNHQPYLFFWQAALEIEEKKRRNARPLSLAPQTGKAEFARIRTDTVVGMAVYNLVAICIIYAIAAALHASGITTLETSSQAAKALRPIAGTMTFAISAAGIIGTGLLAVPVLAVMMLVAAKGCIMGRLTIPRSMLIGGWIATALMLAASIGVFVL